MSIPDYQALMLPVLRLAAAGERRVPEAADAVANQLGLTDTERDELLPSGRQRVLHNRIHWAKFYMSKAGLIDSPARGRFVASETGRALLHTNPTSIDVETLKRYPDFVRFYNASSEGSSAETPATGAAAEATSTPEEQIDAAHAVLHAALKAELLQRILALSPAFFERAIVDLLVAMGYGGSHEDAAQRLGRSGDGGIDGVIDEDRLGLDRIYVQAKRYAPHVGVGRPEIQGFVGSLVGLGASKGVFVTTSSFSSPAADFVRHLPQRIVLIDGNRLAELMIEHEVGVRISRSVEVKRVDEDFFVDD
ncbi:restriction endonuclease [Mesorhizobium sp. RCC_202]|uniref:restriction endonuclease n=1 Tax=Mesorhizobium sp. RCC_202 TaxID=3239222 RepID=UPI0035231A9B